MKKRIVALLLCAGMIISVAGCQEQSENSSTSTPVPTEAQQNNTTNETSDNSSSDNNASVSGAPMNESPDGNGGDAAHTTAAVYISSDALDSSKAYTDGSVTIDHTENIGNTSASDIMMTSNSYDATGLVVTDNSTYTLGGSEDKYSVYSTISKNYFGTGISSSNGSDLLGAFNSVLLFGLDSKIDSAATIGSSGIDVDSGSTLNINNVFMQVDGSRRYVTSNYNDGTLVVNDSYFVSTGDADGYTSDISVPFSNEALLISGTARTNFSIGASKTYYFNSTVIAEGWAALSTDSATGDGLDLYAYNTKADTLNGGYATYADTNCRVSLYGSDLSSAEIGAIISKSGKVTVTDGSSADSDITSYNTGESTTKGSALTAGRNAVVIHAPDMMGEGVKAADCGTLNVYNSTLSTSQSLKSTFDYSTYSDAVKNYVDYVSGDLILIKSTSANITLDKAVMDSYNGVLVHSVLNSDSMGNFLAAGDDENVEPIIVSMKDMNVTGNILHEDYQRNLEITLDNTALDGAIVQGTYDSWNSLWAGYGVTSANWLHDSSWSGTNSLAIHLKSGSTWTVTGDSSCTSLTVDSGAAVNAPSGKTVTMTVNGTETPITEGTFTGNIIITIK